METIESGFNEKDEEIFPAGRECHPHFIAARNEYFKYGRWEYNDFPENLKRDIYHMSEAILKDPVEPFITEDLGLSQAYRLYNFLNPEKDLPKVSFKGLEKLPTIGAEFHLRKEAERIYEKLFVLNMAQYHKKSEIPLSKNDHEVKDLIEIRMNPSYYPVTIANWNLIRKIIQLDDVYFNLTINPPPGGGRGGEKTINKLKSLMNIIYANNYKSVKSSRKNLSPIFNTYMPFACTIGTFFTFNTLLDWKLLPILASFLITGIAGAAAFSAGMMISEKFFAPEIGSLKFGGHYLGYTQKVEKGIFRLSWGRRWTKTGDDDNDEQLNLHSGFGKTFPKQAYYVSMAYLDSEILEIAAREAGENLGIHQAVRMKQKTKSHILTSINRYIEKNPELSKITLKGEEIINSFKR